MSTLVTDTFTGTNGTAPNARWTAVKPSGSTVDIQSNRMRVQAPNTGYIGGAFAYLNAVSEYDVDLKIDVYLGATVKEQYPSIGIRCDASKGVWSGGDAAGAPQTGYAVEFFPGGNGFSVVDCENTTSLSGDLPFTFVAGATYCLRMRAVGTSLKVKLWNKSGAEPTPWTWSGTVAAANPGTLIVAAANGSTQTPIYVDNLTFSSVPRSPSIWHAGVETPAAWTILIGGVEVPVTWSVVLSGIEHELAKNISAPPGSDESVPTIDIHNAFGTWTLDFTDDFSTDVALGSFPSASPKSSRYDVYASGTDTSGYGTYSADKTMSVSDGALKINLHTESSVPYVGCAIVRGTNGSTFSGKTYGRYSTRMRHVQIAGPDSYGYKIAFMLWPVDDMWPDHGEFDYPEATDVTSKSWAQANTHQANATDINTQFLVPGDRLVSQWHVYTIEWSPGRVEYFFDGLSIGASTTKIYDGPMRWTLQCESAIGIGTPNSTIISQIEIDWVAMWSYSAP